MATITDLLDQHRSLKLVSDTALLDSELLLGHCLGKTRSYLKAFGEVDVTLAVANQYGILMQRRNQGEPVAHLLGHRGFWTLDLEVNTSTLIPRPETELLVEQALLRLADSKNLPINVLDLGTGTGAIALALSAERSQWNIIGIDMYSEAVDLARRNQQRNGLEKNTLQFMQSNWFDEVEATQFDLIVSNPPYIDKRDPHLQQGDVRFEPHSALVAETQGFAALQHIILQSKKYLNKSGWLLLEHGYNQAAAVRGTLDKAGFKQIKTIKDLSANDRVSLGQWRGSSGEQA